MMHQADDPNIRRYPHELEARLRHLPAEQSEEILQGIKDHISDALSRGNAMGTRWKLWEKIVGTLILPGGIAGALLIATVPVRFSGSTSSSGTGIPSSTVADSGADVLGTALPIMAMVVTLALPLIVGIYLLIAGLRREQTSMRAAQLTA